MKYCRFQSNNQPHYGLVESVAGVEQITRLFLSSPQDAGGDLEDVPTRRMDHLPLAEAALPFNRPATAPANGPTPGPRRPGRNPVSAATTIIRQ